MTLKYEIDFQHQPGNNNKYYMPESIGSGVAIFDSDNDGLVDIYFLNGYYRSGNRYNQKKSANQLFVQTIENTFVNRTQLSGLGSTEYSMGVAVGDINNDGYPEVYCSNVGSDQLFINHGDGTFTDITESAGIDNLNWGCSTIFLDYNQDGYLDIFVTNYLNYDSLQFCTDRAGRRDYCGPGSFKGIPDVLYKNNGDNTFTDVSTFSNIGAASGRGLGVVSDDFNTDNLADIYVANDGEANHLWINQGDGTFLDKALHLGAAFNMSGMPEAGMGIAIGDVDGDSDMDLFVSHLRGETNTLYVNHGLLGFQDMTDHYNLHKENIHYTGFGTSFIDYDNDADIDLLIANGRVTRGTLLFDNSDPGYWDYYAEPNLLYDYKDHYGYIINQTTCGDFCNAMNNSRGLAVGDVNNDGKIDIVVNNEGGKGKIYLNTIDNENNWLIVDVIDPKKNRHDIGSKVTLHAGGKKYTRLVGNGSSFLSSNDLSIHFGLGKEVRVDRIAVKWLDGTEENFKDIKVNKKIVLEKYSGTINQF